MTAGGLQQDPYGKKLAPKMTKMSNYSNSVSYTILGKRRQRDYSENIPAANKYVSDVFQRSNSA